ncbi:hypothetical protein H6G25_08865 [Dolichospermum sp. FACHB-1091]|jgi:hypothetical protein|uniref:hypothetical protein n=1 Tax=Dolichospermum sp. FACHB-1091 TaxID=2692798 RepID=UPI0016801930|nr:hypothetical protein [Dolichospermum sp. FACHB-1091]MBD2443302.1 hypothetical protein [Dolichospermum sp. FACHB-1091]
MATIIISDLKSVDKNTFLYDLTSEEIQQIVDTDILPLSGGFDLNFLLTTIQDVITNQTSSENGLFASLARNNKIFSLDFSNPSLYLVTR